MYFDVFTLNRHVRKRTLEDDGEKPSRRENEGPLLTPSVYCWFMMDVSQKPGSPTSSNSKASRAFSICERPVMPLFTYLLAHEK